jgi:hypothetical protein
MIREVMWSAWDGRGLGHLRLAVHESSVVADGLVLGVVEGRVFRRWSWAQRSSSSEEMVL